MTDGSDLGWLGLERTGPAEWAFTVTEAGGYVHGTAHIWSERGTLLGAASQTASLVLFDQ